MHRSQRDPDPELIHNTLGGPPSITAGSLLSSHAAAPNFRTDGLLADFMVVLESQRQGSGWLAP